MPRPADTVEGALEAVTLMTVYHRRDCGQNVAGPDNPGHCTCGLDVAKEKARAALATLARQREGAVRVWFCKRDGIAVNRKGDGTTCPVCGCGEMAYGCSWATLHPEREEDSRGT